MRTLFDKFNPSDLTVDEFVSYLPLFDNYIKYPRGLCLSVSDCFHLYNEDESADLLGASNLEYMDYDCEVCSYISQLPIEVFDMINRVFDYGFERDDREILNTSIETVINLYKAHPELH